MATVAGSTSRNSDPAKARENASRQASAFKNSTATVSPVQAYNAALSIAQQEARDSGKTREEDIRALFNKNARDMGIDNVDMAHKVRGEGWFGGTGGDMNTIAYLDQAMEDTGGTLLGGLFTDAIIGNIDRDAQDAAEAFLRDTGVGTALGTAEDIAGAIWLGNIPGVAKAAIGASDDIYEGLITGQDQLTGKNLDFGERALRTGLGLGGVALSAIPGTKAVQNAGRNVGEKLIQPIGREALEAAEKTAINNVDNAGAAFKAPLVEGFDKIAAGRGGQVARLPQAEARALENGTARQAAIDAGEATDDGIARMTHEAIPEPSAAAKQAARLEEGTLGKLMAMKPGQTLTAKSAKAAQEAGENLTRATNKIADSTMGIYDDAFSRRAGSPLARIPKAGDAEGAKRLETARTGALSAADDAIPVAQEKLSKELAQQTAAGLGKNGKENVLDIARRYISDLNAGGSAKVAYQRTLNNARKEAVPSKGIMPWKRAATAAERRNVKLTPEQEAQAAKAMQNRIGQGYGIFRTPNNIDAMFNRAPSAYLAKDIALPQIYNYARGDQSTSVDADSVLINLGIDPGAIVDAVDSGAVTPEEGAAAAEEAGEAIAEAEAAGEISAEEAAAAYTAMQQLALSFIRGDWGNWYDRQAAVELSGLEYQPAQDYVNQLEARKNELGNWTAALAERGLYPQDVPYRLGR